MRISVLLTTIIACGLISGCGQSTPTTATQAQEESASTAEVGVSEARHDLVYACNCGPECTCKSVATAPGTCTCGRDLAWSHLVKVEGDEGLLCTCDEGCSCALDPADETKCSCGGDIRRVSFKGTGLHFCNCGGSCTCNHVSSEPGNCSCGMKLITST